MSACRRWQNGLIFTDIEPFHRLSRQKWTLCQPSQSFVCSLLNSAIGFAARPVNDVIQGHRVIKAPSKVKSRGFGSDRISTSLRPSMSFARAGEIKIL
jgi:hypothetical protein